MTEDWQEGGFGIYLHWPFCEAKCPYCDFNSHVSQSIDQARWRRAYVAELDRYGQDVPGRVVRSIFFGGGTPSLMAPETIAAVLDRIAGIWPLANDVEITLEANPGSVEAARFAAYRDAGVNRVSLGVQALNDPDLKRLGRLHSATEARAALDVARTTFDRVSFDLIYARQDQTLDAWMSELDEALSFGVSHMSLYHLTVEEGTAFGDRLRRGGLRGLPSDDLSAGLYDATVEACEAAGRPMYEVSNFAVPGEESRHNLIYWRYGDYIGIGPGAHGRISASGNRRWATETTLAPARWLHAAETGQGQESRNELGRRDQATEMLLMGLRLREGVSSDRLRRLSGIPLREESIQSLKDSGVLENLSEKIIVSKQYFNVLNAVIEQVCPD